MSVFTRFAPPQVRRRAELHRVVSADARLTQARRAVHEARQTYASELVDQHAATLLRLAFVVSADSAIASSAVVRVIVSAALDHERLEPSPLMLAELSRLTLWACAAPAEAIGLSSAGPRGQIGCRDGDVVLRSIPPRERALAALTMFGDHTYREAAAVLGSDPQTAADLLRLPTGEESGMLLEPMPETTEAMAEFMTRDGPEIDEVLAGLGHRARQLVPGVVGLSLGLVREGVTFTLIASNSGLGALDATQYLDGGPCVEVTEERRDVVQFDTDDPLDEGRWLLFAQTSAATGVASSLSLPILRDGQVIGGINLYASTASAFTGHHDELADALGASASEVVTNADLSFATRLRAARAPAQLRATQEIETATGLLAARYDHNVDRARARLRDAAARAGVEEALVARLMILVHSDDRDANP